MPPAVRVAKPGWRDPRLWVGVALVAGSVVGGAMVIDSADRTVSVWTTAKDLPQGHEVSTEDLVATRVHFADPQAAGSYLQVSAGLPNATALQRGIGAGELLPVAALGAPAAEATVSVAVGVPASSVPRSIEAGSVVDVYVIGETQAGKEMARLVIPDVVVGSAPKLSESFTSASSDRQLVLELPAEETTALSRILTASVDGGVRVVSRG